MSASKFRKAVFYTGVMYQNARAFLLLSITKRYGTAVNNPKIFEIIAFRVPDSRLKVRKTLNFEPSTLN